MIYQHIAYYLVAICNNQYSKVVFLNRNSENYWKLLHGLPGNRVHKLHTVPIDFDVCVYSNQSILLTDYMLIYHYFLQE